MAKSAFTDGHVDGMADATNGKDCNPRGRWIAWHARRPESEWPDYQKGYNNSYDQVAKAEREYARLGGAR